MIIHVVTAGETLYAIARRYGVPPARLMIDNGLTEGQAPVVGQALVVLFAARTYTVQAGDTLQRIAAAFDTSVRQLWRNNPQLNGLPALRVGDTLTIDFDTERTDTLSLNGYAYPFIDPAVLRRTLPYLSSLLIFSYGFEESGALIPADDAALLQAAATYDVPAVLVLTTLSRDGRFRSELATRLLTVPAVQQRLIDELMAVMEAKNYAGVDVDFEYVPVENAAAFAAFVRTLTARANAIGRSVSVALAPKTSADQAGLLYESHDYAALGGAADYALLMTYEWGYTYSEPMAVAPLPSVRRVLTFGVSQIAPQKIYMGIPNYGYDWPLPYVRGETRARTIQNAEAVDIARRYGAEILFDPVAQTPHFTYTDADGIAHEVWFEDARSVQQKLALIPQLGLFGAAYWTVMGWFPANWALANAQYYIR